MARIERLKILGIRSFGGEDGDAQWIDFRNSLTLIQGQNGCGKTTLIESLKYATTGDFPPGTNKGQTFVHDPKMAHSVKIMAQVKLLLKDLKGERVVVVRSLEANQKAKRLEVKSLDSTITRTNKVTGESVSISHRCADVNSEMYQALGVSKAILNNVIFCHQEDSCWPLDEGKKVKEKFDAIFDATKYNKFLDHIKKIRKDKKEKIKTLKLELGYLKDNKDTARQKRQTLKEEETKLGATIDRVKTFKSQLEPIVAQLEEIHARESDINKLENQLVKKKTQLEGLIKVQEELRQSIEYEFNGTTEELRQAMRSFTKELNQKKDSLRTLESRHSELVKNDQSLSQRITNEKVNVGQLKKIEEQQKEQIERRNVVLNRLAEELNLPAFPHSQLTETQVTNVVSQINKKIKMEVAELEQLEKQFEAEEQDLQNKSDNLRDEKVKLEEEIRSKKEQMAKNRREMRKVTDDINQVDTAANELNNVESRLDRSRRELQDLEMSLNVDEVKRQIKGSQERCTSLQDKLESLSKEVQELLAKSNQQADLDRQRENKAAKEVEIRKLRRKYEDSLLGILKTIPEQGIKYELQTAIDNLGREVKDLNKKLNNKQIDFSKLEYKRKTIHEKLKQKEEALRMYEEQIYEECGNQDFETVLNSVKEKIDGLQEKKGTLGASSHMLSMYMKKLRENNPCCPLCHREFDSDNDVDELIAEMNRKVREIPGTLNDTKTTLEQAEQKFNKLQQLKPTCERIKTMRATEIPNIRTELEETDKSLESAKKEMEDLKARLVKPQQDEETAKSMQAGIVLLDQHQTDLRKVEREIEMLEAKMPSGGSTRNVHEAMNEERAVRSDLALERKAFDNKHEMLSTHNEKLQKLKAEENTLVAKKLKIEGGLQHRKQLEDRKEELEVMVGVITEEIEMAQNKLRPIKNQLDASNREKNEMKETHKRELDNCRKKVNALQKREEDIKVRNRNISEYERENIPQKLIAAEQTVRSLETEKKELGEKLNDSADSIGTIKKELTTQQVRERELEDNMKLRQKKEEEEELKVEVDELKKKMGDVRFETLLREKNKLRNQESELTSEKARAEGRQREIESNISSLRKELNKDSLKNADDRYKDKFIEMKVEDVAISDLNKFFMAVDRAIMHFHKERMDTINSIIRELWRVIYRGNDTDYIELKTDEADCTAGADKRHNYNYRVIMNKNGHELDMRSHCSAGQKVLASLIIRMALAETFSVNCGILTLDEPTTNLDQQNINSLCMALVDIVSRRSAQSNFQLVVISHDESFVKKLTRGGSLEYFYRVSRNSEGKSVIEKTAADE